MLHKASLPASVLCSDLPPEFAKILEYIMTLDSREDPDYKYIELLFKRSAETNQILIDNIF